MIEAPTANSCKQDLKTQHGTLSCLGAVFFIFLSNGLISVSLKEVILSIRYVLVIDSFFQDIIIYSCDCSIKLINEIRR
jgi:hypothetical protein